MLKIEVFPELRGYCFPRYLNSVGCMLKSETHQNRLITINIVMEKMQLPRSLIKNVKIIENPKKKQLWILEKWPFASMSCRASLQRRCRLRALPQAAKAAVESASATGAGSSAKAGLGDALTPRDWWHDDFGWFWHILDDWNDILNYMFRDF